MYVTPNFKTKKAFKEAVKAGEHVRLFDPGSFGQAIIDGTTCVEGPHYPEPHRWYASVTIKDNKIVRVI